MNTHADRTLAEIRNELRALNEHQGKLLARLDSLARGTEDVTHAAAVATQAPLADRLQMLVRERPHSTDDLVQRLASPVGPVVEELRALRTDRRVWNCGNEERPRWFWVFGPEASQSDLLHAVTTLIQSQPMELQDLALATGLPPNDVSSLLTKLKRNGLNVENLGNAKRARWFLAPGAVPSRQR